MSFLDWSIEEVKSWLTNTLKLDEQVVRIFEENEIDGEILLNHITDHVLLNRLGVLSYNSRFKILNGIQALKLEDGDPQIIPLVLPTSTSFIFESADETVNINDRDSNKSVENNEQIVTFSDGESSDVIYSNSDEEYMEEYEEEYDSDDDEDGNHLYEGIDALIIDDEGDTIMNMDNDNELENKKDLYESSEAFVSQFHVVRTGKEISKEEEERILSMQKMFGYATKYMHAEDNILLPVYGESDEEGNYVSTDLEEEMNEEEEILSKKTGKKSSLFIYVDKNSPSNDEDITPETSDHEESLVDKVEHLINQYMTKEREKWDNTKKPQLEDRAYYWWSKYYPRKKNAKNATRMTTLQQDLKHLRNERLPQLIEQVKLNLNTIKELTLEKSSVRRACGALDTTLHQVFKIDWILALLVKPEIPQKPAKVPQEKKDVKNVDNNEVNSNEVTDDYEEDEYDPDFIDDSEPVDIDTYNSEWAELYGIPALTIETMKLPEITKRSNEQIAKDNTATCDNSEKSHNSDDDSGEPDVLASSPDGSMQTANDDTIKVDPLSEENSSVVPKVEKPPKKSKDVLDVSAVSKPPNEVIILESDTEAASASDMEIDDDIIESHQYNVNINDNSDVSKINVMPKDFNYIDDDEEYEEPTQLHHQVDAAFLKYAIQELYDQIIELSEKLAFDYDREFADQPVLMRIFNEFRMYLYILCTNNKSCKLKPNSKVAFEQYYIWRKNYVMENRNKRHAEIEVKSESQVGKNYVGDSEDEESDSGNSYGNKKKYKRRKRVKESETVIEQRKARSMLEQDYRTRFDMQSKLVNPSEGVIINLGHHDDEDHIYIPDDIGSKLKAHQIEGVRFLWKNIIMFNKGCVLAHSMGLGKTFQIITFLFTLAYHIRGYRNNTVIPDHLKEFRILILCPKIVVDNWENEFKYWIKDVNKIFDIFKIIGENSITQRHSTISSWFKDGGVLLIGYEMYRNLITQYSPSKDDFSTFLLDPGPSLIVADEGHILKTKDTKLVDVLKGLKTPSRIILTGSPLQNNLVEYWCMIQFVCPNYLGELEDFRKVYMLPIQNGLYKQADLAVQKTSRKMLYVLGNIIEDIVHRRNVSILEQDLPTKIEYLISCRMHGRQLEIYKALIDALKSEGGPNIQYSHLLGVLCNHPGIVLPSLDPDRCGSYKVKENKTKEKTVIDLTGDDGEVAEMTAIDEEKMMPRTVREHIYNIVSNMKDLDAISESCKMEVLIKILEKCESKKDKVLIFSKSIPTLDFIEKIIRKWKPNTDSHFMRIDGNTVSSNRQMLIKDFNETRLWRVALISIRTAALGVNLVGANRVILVDGEWNPSHAEQAIGRAYRYGQTKPVFVYRLITAGTFEDKLFNNSVHKMSLSIRVVDQKNPERKFTKDDLNARMFITPDPNMKSKLPEDINYEDDVLVTVAKEYRENIIDIQGVSSFFIDDSQDFNEEDQRHAQQLLIEEKEKLHKRIN
ncbi:P-loop containing nucleoside triphosphate hydrolase protein [Glomus cerebriforme]|uniref:P-loop containing nucleoside triphosphate hydrolase protein n=1 Tax=Glomus cerebriforme TaxID=658196 RepID=A0A397SWM8_9GLOM|nr:P-loop containing nucleoside triphosphate hydrolase protein [Glomus cerebriforme]